MRDDPPDPKLLKAMHDTSGGLPSAQNAYVAFCGFNTASGGDFVKKGQDIIERANRGEVIEPEEYAFNLIDVYRNPCFILDDTDCFCKILRDKEKIKESINKNQELIGRYHILQNMPFYRDTGNSFNFLPNIAGPLHVSNILSSVAVLNMMDGNVDMALDFIEKDLRFYKKIFYAERSTIIERLLASSAINRYTVLISNIIEQEKIDVEKYQDRLRRMLTPLDNIGEHMADAYYTESLLYAGEIYNKIYLHSKAKQNPLQIELYVYILVNLVYPIHEHKLLDHLFREYKLSHLLSNKLFLAEKALDFFSYKKNKTVHLFYEENRQYIQKIALIQALDFPAQYEKLQNLSKERLISFLLYPSILYKRYGFLPLSNIAGEIYLPPWRQNSYDPYYLARAFDTVALAHLVRAQLEWRLLPEQPDNPCKALAEMGPETFNPYTGRPFQWDAERRRLWFITVAGNDDNNYAYVSLD